MMYYIKRNVFFNYILVSVNYILASVNYILASVNYILASVNYILVSVNYILANLLSFNIYSLINLAFDSKSCILDMYFRHVFYI
jgi:hypothetical protein